MFLRHCRSRGQPGFLLWPGSSLAQGAGQGWIMQVLLASPSLRSLLGPVLPAAGISQDPPQGLTQLLLPVLRRPVLSRITSYASSSPSLSPPESGLRGSDILPVYLSDAPGSPVSASLAEGSGQLVQSARLLPGHAGRCGPPIRLPGRPAELCNLEDARTDPDIFHIITEEQRLPTGSRPRSVNAGELRVRRFLAHSGVSGT